MAVKEGVTEGSWEDLQEGHSRRKERQVQVPGGEERKSVQLEQSGRVEGF